MKVSLSFKPDGLLKALRLKRRSLAAKAIGRLGEGHAAQGRVSLKVKEPRHERSRT